MNKFFVFALFALVAVCSAAPAETPAVDAPLEPVAAAEGLEAHEQEKRAILLATAGGYRYLPEYDSSLQYYRYGYPGVYRYGYPSLPALNYPGYPAYPYRYLL